MLLIDLFDIDDKNEGIVENLIEDGSTVVSSSLIGMRFGKADEFKKHNCLYMLEKDKKDW